MPTCSWEFDQRHFSKGLTEADSFWRRFGRTPSFDGQRVLDLGCGRGALVFRIAGMGPATVLGIDTDPDRIAFAQDKLRGEFRRFDGIASFHCMDLKDMPESAPFDAIISKDCFEHLDDVEGALESIRRCLAPGGKAYIGFGPLYRSPFGDHGWTFARIPWGHLIFSEGFLLRRIQQHQGTAPRSITEIGLNTWSLASFCAAFERSGLRVAFLETNCGAHPVYRLARLAAAIPGLRDYFTFNLYTVLEKPLDSRGNGES